MTPRNLTCLLRLLSPLFAILLVGGCASHARLTENLNQDWRFIRNDVPNAQAKDVDDSYWQQVSLPHTWNNKDGQDGGNNYYRGACWYRRKLEIPKAYSGKSLFLRFDGAATVSDVFVNGKHAGSHRGNFAAFCFDVTDLLSSGENVVAVRVDNSKTEDVPPLTGDFTIFGGLYRDVHLLVLEPLSISPLDEASPGVYWKQAQVTDDRAQIQVLTKLRNASSRPRNATVICKVADRDGRIVAQSSTKQSVEARGVADATTDITVEHPHLWNGGADPYLYQAIVEVQENGRVVDRVTQPLGLRYFRVDPEQGLILNGKHYPLHGVNRHQDRIDKGWAIGPAEHDEDFRLITEMGCTGIRLSHYQHHDYFYSLCDRGGLVVWAEDGLVNETRHTKSFEDNIRQQVRELVKQNYNHPSILFWSLFNELALRQPQNPQDAALIKRLNDDVHELDPTRLTTAATHKKTEQPENWITDLTGFNRYFGWYSGAATDWASALDAMHAAEKDRCIAISEYGAGASVNQHEAKPTTRPRTAGPWHPEEWQCIVHENAWNAMKQRPWLWGTFIWVMFDFAADQRAEGDHPGRNDKGLVTADRKIKKDAFYFYKANWSDEPVIHITSRRFNPRPSGSADIKVYSNCDTVELRLNGHSRGSKTNDDHVFVFPDCFLREGNNTVAAIGTRNGQTFEDDVTFHASRGAATRVGELKSATTSPAVDRAPRPRSATRSSPASR